MKRGVDDPEAGGGDHRQLAKTKKKMFPLGKGPHRDFAKIRRDNMYERSFQHTRRDKDAPHHPLHQGNETTFPGFGKHKSAVQKKFV